MKKKNILLVGSILMMMLFFQSCLEDTCKNKQTYTYYEPIYMQESDIRIDIQSEAPRALLNPGKLYFYNGYVFVNEVREGIHVINNANPANPINEAFIPIPGNLDIAMKNGKLYADNYMDLLVLDMINPSQPQLIKRMEDEFIGFSNNGPAGILVYHRRTEITEEVDCNHLWSNSQVFWQEDGLFANPAIDAQTINSNGASQGDVGIAGSLARFAINDDYMYTIDHSSLKAYSIADVSCPDYRNTTYVGWNIETLFPHGNHMFIGAADGMYIFDITSPEQPQHLSKFQHARACDPVYVNGNKAYVTLRNGNPECDGFENQLDIVDVSDVENPWLIKTYSMQNPHGLSVTNNQKLFLCDGAHGLKILDVTDANNVEQIGELKGFDAYDAIALGENHVMVIGKDGFYQFDTTDPNNVEQLSLLPVAE